MEEMFFLMQVKRTNGTYEKGVVVKDNLSAAKQSYHAYLSAYGYDHDNATDYVQCAIHDMSGAVKVGPEVWEREVVEQVEE